VKECRKKRLLKSQLRAAKRYALHIEKTEGWRLDEGYSLGEVAVLPDGTIRIEQIAAIEDLRKEMLVIGWGKKAPKSSGQRKRKREALRVEASGKFVDFTTRGRRVFRKVTSIKNKVDRILFTILNR